MLVKVEARDIKVIGAVLPKDDLHAVILQGPDDAEDQEVTELADAERHVDLPDPAEGPAFVDAASLKDVVPDLHEARKVDEDVCASDKGEAKEDEGNDRDPRLGVAIEEIDRLEIRVEEQDDRIDEAVACIDEFPKEHPDDPGGDDRQEIEDAVDGLMLLLPQGEDEFREKERHEDVEQKFRKEKDRHGLHGIPKDGILEHLDVILHAEEFPGHRRAAHVEEAHDDAVKERHDGKDGQEAK